MPPGFLSYPFAWQSGQMSLGIGVTSTTSGSKGSRSISVTKYSNSWSQISDWKQCWVVSSITAPGMKIYLEEHRRSISAPLKRFNSNAVKTFLVAAVLCLFPWMLAVFGGAAISIDVCYIWVVCTTVLAHSKGWNLLNAHCDALVIYNMHQLRPGWN